MQAHRARADAHHRRRYPAPRTHRRTREHSAHARPPTAPHPAPATATRARTYLRPRHLIQRNASPAIHPRLGRGRAPRRAAARKPSKTSSGGGGRSRGARAARAAPRRAQVGAGLRFLLLRYGNSARTRVRAGERADVSRIRLIARAYNLISDFRIRGRQAVEVSAARSLRRGKSSSAAPLEGGWVERGGAQGGGGARHTARPHAASPTRGPRQRRSSAGTAPTRHECARGASAVGEGEARILVSAFRSQWWA